MEHTEHVSGRGQSYWSLRRCIRKHVNELSSVAAPLGSETDFSCPTQNWHDDMMDCHNVDTLVDDCVSDDETWWDTDTSSLHSSSDDSTVTSCEEEVQSSFSEASLDMRQFLATWAVSYNISHSALSALLVGFRKFLPQLPCDARSLLKTPRSCTIQTVSSGQLWYSGIASGIRHLHATGFLHGCNQLDLQINVDGLPLFKSSNHQLWPILCRILQCPDSSPFVVAIYSGQQKPANLSEYFNEFVNECSQLILNGLHIENNNYKISLHSFVCDAPARAMLKCVKGHNAYHGCERCTVQGDWINNRMLYLELDAPLRTDDSFEQQTDEDHHSNVSPLTKLKFPMVSGFVLDPMHLLYLGVMRKLLHFWLKGPLTVRLSGSVSRSVSEQLISFHHFIPEEFSRKPRTLSELDRWKATELRMFLLYCGALVLRDKLNFQLYNNFLLLFVGCRILISQLAYNVQMCDFAKSLLRIFVEDLKKLYGQECLVYNIHSLIHVADDAKRYGPLERVSAFPFENKLKDLKRLVRQPDNVLQQILNRLDEKQKNGSVAEKQKNYLVKEHSNGPIPASLSCRVQQYAKMNCLNYSLSLTEGNCCALTKDNKPVFIRNILLINDAVFLLCSQYAHVSPFFDYPVNSEKLQIFSVHLLQPDVMLVPIDDITGKCLRLPLKDPDQFVVLPLLHS